MPHLITPRILHDQPLDQLDDRAEFHFDDYANTFARLVTDRTTRTPLVILVSGKWGSGKTTLLRKIQSKLDETERLGENLSKVSFVNPDEEAKVFRRCRTVWFNAWKYADEDQLLVALVRVIVQTMYADDFISKAASKIFDPAYPRRDVIDTVLGWFAIKTPFGDVNMNTGEPKETPFAEKAALLDLFSDAFDRLSAVWVHRSLDAKKIDATQGVMVVFIDDLDRCLPDKAVQVLEAVKLFLDRPGVVFVLAADEGAIRSAIEAHYVKLNVTDQRADDYLEKIFQVRFPLPPLSDVQARDYLAEALDIADESIKNNVKLIIAGAETNPRQIKTFVNYLETGWSILRNSGQAEGVEKQDFLYWLALTRVSAAFCKKVEKLPKDLRLQYVDDAVRWANGVTEKANEYEEWNSYEHQRLRDVLKLLLFTPKVTPDVLQGFVFWSGLAELEEERRAQEAKQQAELEARQRAAELSRLAPSKLLELASVDDIEESLRAKRESGEWYTRIPPDALLLEYWIPIPAGKFVMGSRDDNKHAQDNERPQHTVDIPYAYRIARYPVTNAEFRKFVQATKHQTTAEERGGASHWLRPRGPDTSIDGLDNHPVVNVSWHDAQAYCKWLTEQLRAEGILKTAEMARLPTEAEWEKAARGEYGKGYPWGDEWDAAKCNNRESGPKGTTPVDQYSPQGDSPYSVADMAGNVSEWCQSKCKKYPYDVSDGREDLGGNDERILRGGSWDFARRDCRAAYRSGRGPAYVDLDIGFRAALSPLGS